MTHALLTAVHLLAATVLGVAIVGVLLAGERARRAQDLVRFTDARRRVALLGRRMLVPAVLALLVTGAWLVARFYGLSSVVRVPWLAAMVALFLFQSVWANAVTRPHAVRLDRLADEARRTGALTPALRKARAEIVPAFGHFVELPVYLLIMAFGALRPSAWTPVFAGCAAAALLAAALAALTARPSAYAAPPSSFSSASVEGEGRS